MRTHWAAEGKENTYDVFDLFTYDIPWQGREDKCSDFSNPSRL